MNGFLKTFPGGYNQRKKNNRTVKIIQLCCFWKWLWIRMVYGVLLWSNLASWREQPHPLNRKLQGQAEHVPISISEHQFKGGAFHAADVFCCFEDPDQLIQLVLVTCMEEIAMLKHERICQNKTKFIFPGLFYQRKENILKQLKEFNCVPANDCVYEWFIVFDFQAI